MKISRTDRARRTRISDREAEAAEFAGYAAAMTGELARMARARGLDMLGYLLEMARVEADAVGGAASTAEGPGADGWSAPAKAA